MTDLRIDYDAALKAYDEHGGKHSEALRAALDAGAHLAAIQMEGLERYADERDDQYDRIIAALDDALGEGSCVERDITDAIRELAQERDQAEKRGAVKALREYAAYLASCRTPGKLLAPAMRSHADCIESGEVTLP